MPPKKSSRRSAKDSSCKDCASLRWQKGRLYYALMNLQDEHWRNVQQQQIVIRELGSTNNLPERVMKVFEEQEKKTDCCICLESMANESRVNLYMLPCCAHFVHNKCATELKESKSDPKGKTPCPFCRTNVSIYVQSSE